MKKFTIPFAECGVDGFEFIETTCYDIDVIDNGQMYMCDFTTGCRILSNQDTLKLTVTEDQEILLRLRFGDKISEIA